LVGWSGCCNLGGDWGRYGLDVGTLCDAGAAAQVRGLTAEVRTCVGVAGGGEQPGGLDLRSQGCESVVASIWRPAVASSIGSEREQATRALKGESWSGRVAIAEHFDVKQQAFLDFVLSHYVAQGVHELDQEKLTPLLRLRYNNSIADAIADLGRPEEIVAVFAGFQRFLYETAA